MFLFDQDYSPCTSFYVFSVKANFKSLFGGWGVLGEDVL